MIRRSLQESAVAVALSLWLAVTPVWAGSMTLTGVGRPGGAPPVGPPTLTFQDRANGNASGSGTGPYTSNSLNVGTASSNRRVYAIYMETDPGNTLTSCTIGGVSCDVLILLGNSGNLTFYVLSAVVPSGTSAAVVYNTTNTVFSAPMIYAWTTDNTTLISPTPTATSYAVESVAGTSLTGSVATSAGSAILMGFAGFGITSGTQNISASDSGMVEDLPQFGSYTAGHSNNALLSAANHVTVSWTPSVAGSSLAVVALR